MNIKVPYDFEHFLFGKTNDFRQKYLEFQRTKLTNECFSKKHGCLYDSLFLL